MHCCGHVVMTNLRVYLLHLTTHPQQCVVEPCINVDALARLTQESALCGPPAKAGIKFQRRVQRTSDHKVDTSSLNIYSTDLVFPTSPSWRFFSRSLFFSSSSWILASIWASDSRVNGRNVGRSSSV
jgi:hypothetical protein